MLVYESQLDVLYHSSFGVHIDNRKSQAQCDYLLRFTFYTTVAGQFGAEDGVPYQELLTSDEVNIFMGQITYIIHSFQTFGKY